LYGRDHIYKTDFIVDRLRELAETYQKEREW